MRLTQLFIVVVFAVGAQSIGCMTEPSDSEVADHTGSEMSALTSTGAQPHVSTGVRCSDKDWQITFWAEPEMIHPVGTMTCFCWQLEDLTGSISQWSSLNYEDTCGGGGGPDQ